MVLFYSSVQPVKMFLFTSYLIRLKTKYLMVSYLKFSLSTSISQGELRQVLLSNHYGDVIMGAIASQIASLTIVDSTVYLDADQRKHQSSVSLAFVRGIHRRPVNSPHKWPVLVARKMFPFDDVMSCPLDPCTCVANKLRPFIVYGPI